jgi:hypothetical protein
VHYEHADYLCKELDLSSMNVALIMSPLGTSLEATQHLFERFMGNCEISYYNNDYYSEHPEDFNMPSGSNLGVITGNSTGDVSNNHAVVMTNYSSGTFTYWDPQNQTSGTCTWQDIFTMLTASGSESED